MFCVVRIDCAVRESIGSHDGKKRGKRAVSMVS